MNRLLLAPAETRYRTELNIELSSVIDIKTTKAKLKPTNRYQQVPEDWGEKVTAGVCPIGLFRTLSNI